MKNNLKIKLFWIFSTCFGFFLNAQTDAAPARTRVKWGDTYETRSGTNISKIVMTQNGGFYVLRTKAPSGFRLGGGGSTKVVMEYYDQNMRLKKGRELELEYKGKDREFKDVIATNDGKMYLLTHFYNQKQQITYLFAQQIDNENLTLSDKIEKIAEQEGKNKDKLDLFGYTLSPDSSKILIYSRPIERTDKVEKEEYSISIFDNKMTLDWEKILTLPYPSDRFNIEEMQVDNAGNVFTLGIIYREGATRLKRGGKPTYEYDLVAFMKNADKPKEYKIGNENEFITDLTFRPTPNGEIVLGGFYSEKGTFSIKGTCYFRLNPVTELFGATQKSPFSLDFMTTHLSEKNKVKAQKAAQNNDPTDDRELYDYALNDLVVRPDGSVLVVAEQYFLEEQYQNNNNNGFGSGLYGNRGFYDPYYSSGIYGNNLNTRRDFIFHYNDIIVVNLDKEGKQVWASQIPKNQATMNDNGLLSSFVMAESEGKLHFIFNDNARNFAKKGGQKTYRYNFSNNSDAMVVMATLDADGKMELKPLFNDDAAGVSTRPKICRQVGKNAIAIYGEHRNSYRFGLVLTQ
ncbi:MAG: hypothetical protein RL757_1157 [Bacteroidota bacterium]